MWCQALACTSEQHYNATPVADWHTLIGVLVCKWGCLYMGTLLIYGHTLVNGVPHSSAFSVVSFVFSIPALSHTSSSFLSIAYYSNQAKLFRITKPLTLYLIPRHHHHLSFSFILFLISFSSHLVPELVTCWVSTKKVHNWHHVTMSQGPFSLLFTKPNRLENLLQYQLWIPHVHYCPSVPPIFVLPNHTIFRG